MSGWKCFWCDWWWPLATAPEPGAECDNCGSADLEPADREVPDEH